MHSVSWNEYSASLTSETRTVDLDADGEGPHVFELQPQYLLEVDLAEPGLSLDNLTPWVDARGAEDSEPRALSRTSDGPFVLNGLEPGTYTVRAGRTKDEPLVERAVEIVEASTALTLELPPIEPSDFLVARCVDGSGRAVQDVTFRSRVESSTRWTSSGLRGDARPGGEHWIAWSTIRSQGIEPEGGFTLVARSKSLGSRDARVAPGAERVEIVFESPADVTVLVQGAERRGSLGASLGSKDGASAAGMPWDQPNVVEVDSNGRGGVRRPFEPGEVLFVPAEVTGQIVAWIQEDKAGYEAGLRMGDVIVASSASEGGPERFQYDLQIALKQGPVTLEIERDGSRTSITIPTSGDGSEVDLGVHMRSRLAR